MHCKIFIKSAKILIEWFARIEYPLCVYVNINLNNLTSSDGEGLFAVRARELMGSHYQQIERLL